MEKKKRGRPRKIVEEPKVEPQVESLVESKLVEIASTQEWDVPIGLDIPYFDANLSYELTGYKPINDASGLDFNPNWFTETRDVFNQTGQYCRYLKGSKAFADFWKEQYRRCKYGMTVNGYTITGDHYFFLNFYRLKDLVNVSEGGSGRNIIFPNFFEGQYEWFHYLDMAKKLRLNACMMKAREAGYSEIEASIIVKSYTVIRDSVNVCCSFAENQLNKLFEKINACLSFIDMNAPGFTHGRIADSALLKRAGLFKMINGTKVPTGWGSQIQGIVVDKPGKLRGDRTDILMFEEVGLWPNFTKAYTMADALVGQIGRQFGLRLLGGTGGETGALMEGLRKVYYNPEVFGVLPFKHKYTLSGEEAITSFFLPAFKTVKDLSLLDDRGYISEENGRKYFDRVRAIKAKDPQELITYCAEFCYNGEEAFSLEGENKFNKQIIAEQLAEIRLFKRAPEIESGYVEYIYKDGVHNEKNITGLRWIPNNKSKLKILEHPIWTIPDLYDNEGRLVKQYPKEKIDNLYVIGIDGIDIGNSQTSEATKSPSDFCLVVKKRVYGLAEPLYVAIYKDRPDDINEAYKIAIKLAQYYNATINIEATRMSFFIWARNKNYTRYFMRRPRATLTDALRNTNKQYGTPATLIIIAHLTDLIADYVNEFGHTIWFEEMLELLNQYSDANKKKFDIVAALGMAELADEELSGVVPKALMNVESTWQDVGYYTDSDGAVRWGVIPKQRELKFSNTIAYDDYGIRTSDPRIY